MYSRRKNWANFSNWDHENEWDEEDYFDEFGVQMPEEVKFQNIYLIGKNLYDCFSRMIPV